MRWSHTTALIFHWATRQNMHSYVYSISQVCLTLHISVQKNSNTTKLVSVRHSLLKNYINWTLQTVKSLVKKTQKKKTKKLPNPFGGTFSHESCYANVSKHFLGTDEQQVYTKMEICSIRCRYNDASVQENVTPKGNDLRKGSRNNANIDCHT